jgi:hypothetical protein
MSKKTSNSERLNLQKVKGKFDPKVLLEIFDLVEQERNQEKELIRALRAGESSDRIAHFNPQNHLLDLHKKSHE